MTGVVVQDKPVVMLNPVVPVQPAFNVVGVVDMPVKHDTPVVMLKPEVEEQPCGKVPETVVVVLVTKIARDLAPNIPSAVKPLDFCQAMTAIFVFGPKLPSAFIFKFICRHFTSFPLEPSFKVVVMVQEEARAVFVKVRAPRKTKANTKTKPKIFFSILSIDIL